MEICAMCGRYTGENNDHVCSECRNSVQHVPFLDLESKVQETLKREEEQEKQIEEMVKALSTMPPVVMSETEDVVPRSEVERLEAQIRRLKAYDEERDIALHRRLVRKAKQEVASEIFEEIEQKCLFEENVGCSEAKLLDEEAYAELKKKYIGE